MNKHILLAMKWLDSPNSVSKEELKKNAADAAAADAAAVYAAAVYDAAVYAAYAEKWINKYFDRTKENKQDYIDAIKGKAK